MMNASHPASNACAGNATVTSRSPAGPGSELPGNSQGLASRNAKRLIYLLPLFMLFAYWLLNPFASPLVTKTVSTSELNSAQKYNIALAARSIDGTVLKPGQEFSFNARVGPRTERRGYRQARTYIGEDSPLTAGGGICCLSSLIYQAALQGGLDISKRTAHQRTVRTVPPGLDATVWYGSVDLCFRNKTSKPLELSCRTTGNSLTVELLGDRFTPRSAACPVRTEVSRRAADQLQVQVFRSRAGTEELVSRDLYRLSR